MKLRHGTPEEAGVSATATKLIVARGQQWIDKGIHPALVVLAARKGVIFLQEAYGKLTPAEDAPHLSLDAIFGLASLTKPITATCAMLLVEDGLLGLNRPLQEYIPEFVGEGKEQVMVHHLLTHTSGLAQDDVIWDDVVTQGLNFDEISDLAKNEHSAIHYYLQYAIEAAAVRRPGEWMEYSNAGIYLLGEIVRRVSGNSLDAFATHRIFEPLGMKSTRYILPLELQQRVCLRPDNAPGDFLNDIEFMERPSPAAGVYSSARDMAIFGQMFLNQGHYGDVQILSPITVAAMTRNQLPGVRAKYFGDEFPEASWGLGWSVTAEFKGEIYGEQLLSPISYGHGGGGGTVLWMDPEKELLLVYFSIETQTSEDRPILSADLFMNMVVAAIKDY